MDSYWFCIAFNSWLYYKFRLTQYNSRYTRPASYSFGAYILLEKSYSFLFVCKLYSLISYTIEQLKTSKYSNILQFYNFGTAHKSVCLLLRLNNLPLYKPLFQLGAYRASTDSRYLTRFTDNALITTITTWKIF